MIMSSSMIISPYVRLRSEKTKREANIPTPFHCADNDDTPFENHASTANKSSTSTTSNMEVAIPDLNKSDYSYSTQSTNNGCKHSHKLIRVLDDFAETEAFVSHITEPMQTTNSVTMKCDFNAYLSNFNISRNLTLDQCTTLSRASQKTLNEFKTVIVSASHVRRSSYTMFDDLLAMVANEKELLKRAVLESRGSSQPRLRLCGGGEDSLNNGTSAWGTPPATANRTSAWGMSNQQPPQAWGGTPGSSNATNNNNNNQPPTSQSQRQPSQSQDQNANKAQQASNTAGNSAPNAWNRNPTQATGLNPSIANNNLQLQQQQQQPIQQPSQQQQQQLALGNNGTIAAKSQLEQLSNMREALFSQDGWSCQNVNQDTNWEVPGSPEPGKNDSNAAAGGGGTGSAGNGPNSASTSGWKPCNTNNGTELWEANLRNGGQPQQSQQVQKAPWGPASNIGGTWGEDDDSNEANVWNGGAAANQQTTASQAWGQSNSALWPPGTAGAPNPNTVKKENDWGGVGVIGANTGATAPVPPNVPGWDVRGGAAPAVNIPGPIGQNTPMEPTRDIRGDPRGISGRLNGNVGMWDQPSIPNLPAIAKLGHGPLPTNAAATNAQWNSPVQNKLPGTWDDASSPMNTRPSLDDGPGGLWNQGPLARQNSNMSNWKDMSDNASRNSMSRTPAGNMLLGGPVTRGMRLGGMNPGIKPDNNMWGQNQGLPMNNSSWDEGSSGGGASGSGWDEKNMGVSGPWNDFGQNNLWNKSKQGSGWPDPNDMIGGGIGAGGEWNMNKPPNKLSPADFIRNSKQYRMLCENGFKKDDVECALRNTNMNFEESLDILQRHSAASGLGGGDWRRPDDHPGGSFDSPFSNRFSTGHGPGMPFSQNQNLLNNLPGVGGANPNLAALNNIKYLSQGPVAAHSSYSQGPNPLAAAATGNPQNAQAQPSTQQLRMLVQQIQMAVQAGFLNHQILNQPLAPTTLLLLNQLLSQIRQMQHIQSNLARSGGATGVSTVQLTMQINKHKAQINTLQQQIAAQQAIYVKQQQQPQQQQQQQQHLPSGPHHQAGPGLGGADFLRQQDLVSLQSNFGDMALGKDAVTSSGGFSTSVVATAVNSSASCGTVNAGIATGTPGVTSQQSRLNQWKLPSLDKDSGAGGANDLTDFSRAPGTTAKSTLSTANSSMSSLGLQEGTWSSGRSHMADGWPDQNSSVNDSDPKDWNSSQDNAGFSDLVPEFEPGKPWKGAQMKIDDDPSITPGSVARSPLSIATAKEADLFNTAGKTSPTDAMGLASSTWGFNPSHTSGAATSKLVGGSAGKNAWPENITSTTTTSSSDLWGTAVGKTTRGPPPGLGANKNVSSAANGWTGSSGAQRSGSGSNWSSGTGWGSSWLLLKNLTSQIDGATVRTLCMQHGPLQNLQLYSNHGLALIKYSTRDEASKAQQALNNCPLGNSTIGAECPSESEVQAYLQQLGVPVGNITSSTMVVPPNSSGGITTVAQSWRQPPRTSNSDTWGSGWPPSSTGTNSILWTPLEGATERGTPSNLNSFLPESLLGTELN